MSFPKIKLTPINEQTEIDLSATKDEFSATKNERFSDTKKRDFSATKLAEFSDTNISDTNVEKFSATKYMNDYKKEHYDTIRFDIKRGGKAVLQNEAAKRGISLTQMIKDALKMYLENTK